MGVARVTGLVWPPAAYKNADGVQWKSGPFELTGPQLKDLQALRAELAGMEFHDRFRLTDEDLVLRFFIAAKFDGKKAAEMIQANMAWRVGDGIEGVFEWAVEHVPPKVVRNTHTDGYIGFYGFDREGHPVWWEKVNEAGIKEYLAALPEATCLKWHTYCMERIRQHCQHLGTDRVTMVVDAADMSCSGVAFGAISAMLKMQSAQDQAMFPELLFKLIIINAPFGSSSVYRVIRPFLDVRVQEKIFVDGKRYTNDPLDKYIAPDNVPAAFGGTVAVDFDLCRCVPSSDSHIFRHPCYEGKYVIPPPGDAGPPAAATG
eukprot:TRINITY_DN16502_c0_g1_i1.p1 TRINITY_DN16502_c0_g1~~TRINITY_DN16502_c0_g1_i1.p1  ORF type:complete len:333 (+),score=126.65 TRINITY_DN16502_c0_g1_i1:51-1001(+)